MIKLPAILDRYSRKKDRSYGLTFVTGLEVSKKDRDTIDDLWQSEGWLIFAPNDVKEVEIPKENADFQDGKSPSKRLYDVLFVYYKQNEERLKEKYPLFQNFYAAKMDEWIEGIKSKLI